MYKFGKKSLERINHPKFHPKLKLVLMESIKTSPIDFAVIETIRDEEQQKINVAKGVSKTMKSVHIPKNNKSQLCEAFDAVPYPIDWKDTKRFHILSEHILKTAKNLGVELEWGGTWKTLIDLPHYQLKK